MDKEELKKYLKENLTIEVDLKEHSNEKSYQVTLRIEGEYIDENTIYI